MVKQEVLERLNSLSEDKLHELYFKLMLKKSQEEIARGEYSTLEEFDEEMEALYESSIIENSKTKY